MGWLGKWLTSGWLLYCNFCISSLTKLPKWGQCFCLFPPVMVPCCLPFPLEHSPVASRPDGEVGQGGEWAFGGNGVEEGPQPDAFRQGGRRLRESSALQSLCGCTRGIRLGWVSGAITILKGALSQNYALKGKLTLKCCLQWHANGPAGTARPFCWVARLSLFERPDCDGETMSATSTLCCGRPNANWGCCSLLLSGLDRTFQGSMEQGQNLFERLATCCMSCDTVKTPTMKRCDAEAAPRHCINHVSLCQSLLSKFLPRLPCTNQEHHILEHNCLTFTRAACKHLCRDHRVGNVKRSRLELHLRQFHDCCRFPV